MRNSFNYTIVNAQTCLYKILTIACYRRSLYVKLRGSKAVDLLKLWSDYIQRLTLVWAVVLIKKLSVRCDKHKLCGCRACVYAKISVAPVSSDVFIFKIRLLVSFHESIIFLTACKQWLAYHDIVSSLCVHYLVKGFVYSHFLSKSVSMKCRTESHIAGRIFRKYSVFLVKV